MDIALLLSRILYRYTEVLLAVFPQEYAEDPFIVTTQRGSIGISPFAYIHGSL